ncbi:VirB6/TrbL-like conjugal transfer protein, CD1112 family, partial [Faecalibacterium duncaniae]
SGLFDNVNAKVGEIASDVGSTPQAWNSGIFNMLRSLSETVVLPIAAAILALVMCHELIQMITERNNMHDVDTFMFFKWFFKAFVAVFLVTHTFDITMAVFDMAQHI